MTTRWRLLTVVALILLIASACSDDDPAPVASTPDITAAPETDAVEPDPGETTRESEQPAPAEEAEEADLERQDAEPQDAEPQDAGQADLEVFQPEAESALEQLRRRMAAAAAFGGLIPSMTIVEELHRNAEGFSY